MLGVRLLTSKLEMVWQIPSSSSLCAWMVTVLCAEKKLHVTETDESRAESEARLAVDIGKIKGLGQGRY